MFFLPFLFFTSSFSLAFHNLSYVRQCTINDIVYKSVLFVWSLPLKACTPFLFLISGVTRTFLLCIFSYVPEYLPSWVGIRMRNSNPPFLGFCFLLFSFLLVSFFLSRPQTPMNERSKRLYNKVK